MDQEQFAKQLLLEDYKLWLRELEKQDRWLYQGIWTVLAASAAAFFVVFRADTSAARIAGSISIAVGALVFVSLNGQFLATRVASYRMVSRRVAAVRKAARVLEILGEESYRNQGIPMLSDNPEAFTRTALSGRSRSYRPLLLLHVFALWAVYVLLAGFLWREARSQLMAAACLVVGLIHYAVAVTRIRYHAAEAESIAAFLVTLGRDQNVRVARDAEERLARWIQRASGSRVLEECDRAVRVIVAYEDRRYWCHPGVDVLSVASCILRHRKRGGASTIPMQLARQLIPNPLAGGLGAKLRRKLFEAALATWLVVRYGKKVVLTAWLQVVPYGTPRILGLEAAASRYFDKKPAELDELDALLLAERITVYTGRYYPARIERLAGWALRRRLISDAQAAQACLRYVAMQVRVPSA